MPLPVRLQYFALIMVGWVSRGQQDVIAYLQTEIAVLREQLAGRRLVLTDAQRRRLARAGQVLGSRGLAGVASLVTADTILRWFRELVARKYEGTRRSSQSGMLRFYHRAAA